LCHVFFAGSMKLPKKRRVAFGRSMVPAKKSSSSAKANFSAPIGMLVGTKATRRWRGAPTPISTPRAIASFGLRTELSSRSKLVVVCAGAALDKSLRQTPIEFTKQWRCHSEIIRMSGEDTLAIIGKKILIIGGGFSGMSAALQLRKAGADVDLVEIDPGWRSYGAGITLGGAALRAFCTLGMIDAFLQNGAAADGVDVFTSAGHPIANLPTPRVAGPDIPGGGAIMRPMLASILADATRASGTNVRLGTTLKTLSNREDGVVVGFSDGSQMSYDLAIGADGQSSKTRATVFPNAPNPRYTGQCVWRALLPRFPEVNRATMWMGHKVKAGLNPVSPEQMYLFVTEDRPNNDRIDPARFLDMLKALLAPFTAATVKAVRETLNPSSLIVYRPLEALLLPRPWYKRRVVLIGDAVHATTPHLAAGACIGLEDAIVLAEELDRAAGIQEGLKAFEARRWERCRMVVENSVRLGEIEIADGDRKEYAAIMRDSALALAAPI
jgi:2-polyprenyl-6-methoxyphenol hydroxylase-like FAD-dependent oxidoreductase